MTEKMKISALIKGFLIFGNRIATLIRCKFTGYRTFLVKISTLYKNAWLQKYQYCNLIIHRLFQSSQSNLKI
jgi:hypothetical protein